MKCTSLALAICVSVHLALASPISEAQQPRKLPEIGFLDPSSPSSFYFEGFKEGLRELGYVDGVTIVLAPQFADGKSDRLPNLAIELVRRNVDVIVSVGGAATAAAKNATQRIPIVMGYSGDPVAAGVVASMAHPGGNITGLGFLSAELAGKRLELLKAVVPKLSRVAVLSNPSHPGERLDWQETQTGARKLNITLEYVAVRTPDDFDEAFLTITRLKITRNRVDGIFVIPDALTLGQAGRIAEFAIKARLPTMAAWSEYTKAGALMSYGPILREVYRRAAWFVDRIIKGANPAELPIEQPTQVTLAINLNTAKKLGITIPPDVLLQAQEVVR